VSQDGGHTWKPIDRLRGQSSSRLRRPVESACLFLPGRGRCLPLQRSGVTWSLISPEGSKEIHEVESLAIDPMIPNYLRGHVAPALEDYRWRKNWSSIKQGVIEDSDVFSIIIDPASPAQFS